MKKELNSFQDFDPNYLERVSMCFGTHIKTQEAERGQQRCQGNDRRRGNSERAG